MCYLIYSMEDDLKKLHEEVEKTRSQLYLFYELTKAMRSTLRLEEIVYIILTGLTAHHGLAFNRAALFLVDEKNKNLKGFMGIGPIDSHEASTIWDSIENQKMDLYDLIEAYHRLKEGKKPRFMEFIESLSFPLDNRSSLVCKILYAKDPTYIKEEDLNNLKDDPFINHLKLKDFLAASLWIEENPMGIIFADNYITKKPINDDGVRIFNMFVDQAKGAIKNSKTFEDTLFKAHTDSLTGLWNYGYFQYRLDEEIVNAQSQNQNVSLMMIDVDDFKKFNDTYGHLHGDKALREIGLTVKESCRKVDILCRYGGEEFSLILPSINADEAAFLGERIRESVQNKNIMNAGFTISIGISSFPQKSSDKESLIKSADEALYKAKRSGKNQVIIA